MADSGTRAIPNQCGAFRDQICVVVRLAEAVIEQRQLSNGRRTSTDRQDMVDASQQIAIERARRAIGRIASAVACRLGCSRTAERRTAVVVDVLTADGDYSVSGLEADPVGEEIAIE